MKPVIMKHIAIIAVVFVATLWPFQPVFGQTTNVAPSANQAKAQLYLAKALELVAGIADDGKKATALAEIAPVQAKAGDLSGAFHTVARIDKEVQDERRRQMRGASALRTIAGAQAGAGDVKGAFTTAERLTDKVSGKDAFAFGLIAKAQAEAGDITGALRTAETIEDKKSKETALKWVAEAKAKSGEPSTPSKANSVPETESAVEVLPSGYERCMGYVGLAKSLLVNSIPK